jgi:hypothetical protein
MPVASLIGKQGVNACKAQAGSNAALVAPVGLFFPPDFLADQRV